MKIYLSTLLFIILTLTLFAQKHPTIWKGIPIPGKQQVEPPIANNSISWQVPNTLSSTVEHSEYKIKACIKPRLKVDSVVLYLNGKRKLDKGENDYEITNRCFYFREEITLLSGKNTVKLIAHFKDGSKEESLERIITYTPSPIEGKYYALLIGVGEYGGVQFRPITNPSPVDHVNKLRDTLDKYYHFDSIKMLSNPNRQEVFNAFEELDKIMIEGKDNLLIFFSGHGTREAWHLKNAKRKTNPNTYIKHLEVYQYLEKIAPHHLLVIVDACYGSSFCDVKPEITPPLEYLTITKNQMEEADCNNSMSYASYFCFSSGALQKVNNNDKFIDALTTELREQEEALCITGRDLCYHVEKRIRKGKVTPLNKPIDLFTIDGPVGDFVFLPKKYWIIPKN